jgi:outer membrane biosynthesis protein TonB
MDDRMVVPAGRSDAAPLDGRTNIPAHMPLGVLVETTLVPRGMPIKPIERTAATQEAGAIALEVLDSRLVVPAHIRPLAPEFREDQIHRPAVSAELREVVEPDIFITGDANLLIEPEEKHDSKWDNLSRAASIVAHMALILFLINIPRIFKPYVPSADDIARAQKELSFVYLPPETAAPAPPAPKLPKIDPKMLRNMAPPDERPVEPAPVPAPQPPQPVKPAPDLPEAPVPHVAPQAPQAQTTPPQTLPQPPLPSALEPIKPQPGRRLNLQPEMSPGEVLRQQENQAAGQHSGGYSSEVPLSGTGGRGVAPTIGNSVQILTPTEGVDFDPYIRRMLETIKGNWEAVMPQSALLGDKGVVYVTFQINPDGSIQRTDPQLERTSSKPPLDNAAMSSIRASNPFEPLPKEFHGPYMRFGIFFLYSLPIDYLNNH